MQSRFYHRLFLTVERLEVRSRNITFQISTLKQRLSDCVTDRAKASPHASSSWEGSRPRKAQKGLKGNSSLPDRICID